MWCDVHRKQADIRPTKKWWPNSAGWIKVSFFLSAFTQQYKVLISLTFDLFQRTVDPCIRPHKGRSLSRPPLCPPGRPSALWADSLKRLCPLPSPLRANMADVCGSAEAQFHPYSTDSDSRSEQLRTVSRGPTELLQDSVIRDPIRRTRSHVTVSGGALWSFQTTSNNLCALLLITWNGDFAF